MGEGIVLGRSTMSKPAVYLVVAGKLNHADFQKAKIAAESLQEFHGNEGLNVTIKAMVPTEWDVFKGNTTRILGGVLLSKSHKAPPLVFLEADDGTPQGATVQPCISLHHLGRWYLNCTGGIALSIAVVRFKAVE